MAEMNDDSNSVPESKSKLPDPIEQLRRSRRSHETQDEVSPEPVGRSSKERLAKALDHAKVCARIAADNRAKDIALLDLRKSTSLVDYFVIATAPSRRQANAIVTEIDQEMKKIQEFKLGMEGSEEGRWTLIDYGDFVVHILSEEARNYYALEDIWGDAPQIDWEAKGDSSPSAS